MRQLGNRYRERMCLRRIAEGVEKDSDVATDIRRFHETRRGDSAVRDYLLSISQSPFWGLIPVGMRGGGPSFSSSAFKGSLACGSNTAFPLDILQRRQPLLRSDRFATPFFGSQMLRQLWWTVQVDTYDRHWGLFG